MGGGFGGLGNKVGQLVSNAKAVGVTPPPAGQFGEQMGNSPVNNANLFNSGNSFQNVQNRRLMSNPLFQQGFGRRRFM